MRLQFTSRSLDPDSNYISISIGVSACLLLLFELQFTLLSFSSFLYLACSKYR